MYGISITLIDQNGYVHNMSVFLLYSDRQVNRAYIFIYVLREIV